MGLVKLKKNVDCGPDPVPSSVRVRANTDQVPTSYREEEGGGRAEGWEVEMERGQGRKEGGKGDGGRRIKSGDEEDREWQTRVEVERDGQGDELKSPPRGEYGRKLVPAKLIVNVTGGFRLADT